jgi:glycerate kinase
MAQALGVRFFYHDKTEILDKMCGNLLGKVATIDMNYLHPGIQDSRITVACDVTNPLLGEDGSARVYARQKGATSMVVTQIEKNMKRFIDVAEKSIGRSVRHVSGAGAAGGLGAGLLLFLGADLRPGAELVMDAYRFSERIRDADLILTGEGKIDMQTTFGKTIIGIASRAKKPKIPVIAFAGIVENADNLSEIGITDVFSICPKSMSINQAMADAKSLLQKTVERVIRAYKFH